MFKKLCYLVCVTTSVLCVIFNIETVHGDSMYKTLPEDSIIITKRDNIGRGDLVIFDNRVKRVIGEKGDTVTIKNGVLKVNGEVLTLNGDYLEIDSSYDINLLVNDGYFVLGESLDSVDSKQLGSITNIKEKVILILKGRD